MMAMPIVANAADIGCVFVPELCSIGAKVPPKGLTQSTATKSELTSETDGTSSELPELPAHLKILDVKTFTASNKSPQSPPKKPGSDNGSKNKNYRKSKNSKIIGDRGEELVLQYERERLIGIGRPDLAKNIVHEAGIGNTPGWDISSFNKDGENILIEVKSTVGKAMKGFSLTVNEWNAARILENREKYYIYLILDAISEKGSRIEIIENPYKLIKSGILSVSLESVSIGL